MIKKALQVLKKFNRALKEGGSIYIQSLNPFVYATKFEKYCEWRKTKRGFRLISVTFDYLSQTVKGKNYYITQEGQVIKEKRNDIKTINFRIFTPMQWIHFLSKAGFSSYKFFGSQKVPLEEFKVSSLELIITAKKISQR